MQISFIDGHLVLLQSNRDGEEEREGESWRLESKLCCHSVASSLKIMIMTSEERNN